jgi:tetratricopeptide (TPR) repeat protein
MSAGEIDVDVREVKLKDLAASALSRGDLERAETLYRNLLVYEREVHGDDWAGQLGILTVLSRILVLRGEFTEAVSWLEKSLVIHVSCFGAESLEAAQAMTALAGIMRKSADADQHHEAEQLSLQALEIMYKRYGKEGHADIATAMVGMGMCVERIGRLAEARQIYEDALAMRRKHLGNNHADTGDALLCLAALLSRTWETSVAMVRYEQAISVFRAVYSDQPQHPRVELVKDSLATLYRRQAKEQWEQSLFGEACVSSMAADRRVLGSAVVSGYFFKKEPGALGLGSVNKKLFAALFPVADDDASTGEGAPTPTLLLLLWAFDADLSSQSRALPGATVFGSVWRAIQPTHARRPRTGSDLYGEGNAVQISASGAEVVARSVGSHQVVSIVQGSTELFSGSTDDPSTSAAWREAMQHGGVNTNSV